ncbi:MAG: lamin tail domain-containing protein [Candidatus Nealsonbacteria bacterium]|nr:lamin tail domain-containing protein [Candidatus Nealsonbacteria bacterium]
MLNLSRGIAFLLFLLLFFPFPSFGSPDVIINEIAWMGTEKSSSDEWIELYNNSDSPVSVDNWTLKSLTGTLKINLKGIIPSKGFYLLERSDDDTIPSVKADLIYTGALKNTGEIIELCNNLVNSVDSVDCSNGWPAGDNETKQTMERIALGSDWQTSKDVGGTPKSQNSAGAAAKAGLAPAKETPVKTTTDEKPAESPVADLSLGYPTGIILNEVLPSPEGADDQNEWIEIFNQNIFKVDLSGWSISDSAGSTKTYIFPENTKILPKGFLVLPRPLTGIVLNNEGDGLTLFGPDEKIIDSVVYGKAVLKESYARTDSSWSWSSALTPGATNKIISPGQEKPQEKQVKGQDEESATSEKRLAAISEPIKEIKEKKGYNSFSISFVALTISLFSGIVILALKKKTKQLSK